MNRMKTLLSGAALLGLLSFAAVAQTPAPAAKQAKPAAAKTAKPVKSDADIQADIQKRLSEAPKLKSESITVAVANGVATFTGTVKNSGSKGGVTSLAKAAGAKSVVNNITIDKPAKPAKPAPAPKPAPAAKPAAPAKKP